jgi:hypothetical protein
LDIGWLGAQRCNLLRRPRRLFCRSGSRPWCAGLLDVNAIPRASGSRFPEEWSEVSAPVASSSEACAPFSQTKYSLRLISGNIRRSWLATRLFHFVSACFHSTGVEACQKTISALLQAWKFHGAVVFAFLNVIPDKLIGDPGCLPSRQFLILQNQRMADGKLLPALAADDSLHQDVTGDCRRRDSAQTSCDTVRVHQR